MAASRREHVFLASVCIIVVPQKALGQEMRA